MGNTANKLTRFLPFHDRGAMKLRRSGIELLGEVPWGTHLCQFYETARDLTDILVPYFKAGLEDGEYCMWVVSAPLSVEDAAGAMRGGVPGFDEMVADGRMEILSHADWYLEDGRFDLEHVIDGWKERLKEAQARGLSGLRASGNTGWLEDAQWADFREYEEALDRAIVNHNLMAVCTYSLDMCGASEIIDVINNHRYALIKRDGDWALIESAERKKAEAEFKTVVRTAMDGFWISNLEGRLLDVNDAFCRLSGYRREDLLDKTIASLEALENPGDVLERIGRIKENGQDRFETRHRRKDGTEIDVEISVNYTGFGDGRLFVFIRDISERTKAEKEMLKVNAELDRYAHAVSHDLRGPLSAIKLSCALMQDVQRDGTTEEMVREADNLVRSVDLHLGRCYSLIDNMLSLAEAGQRPTATEPVDVSRVVAGVLEERAGDITERGVRVFVDDNLGIVEASPTHIYQIFSNLISNAIKHNDSDGPVVEVRLVRRDESGGVTYRVKDNGSGIPEEDFENIFLPFFRRGKASDTGIGLTTVEKIVNVYNGYVRPCNDGGACFEFLLRKL